MTKPNVGDIIRVEFWDHADGPSPVIIEAFGRVVSLDMVSLYLVGWAVAIAKDDFDSEHGWSILFSTLISVTVYEKGHT